MELPKCFIVAKYIDKYHLLHNDIENIEKTDVEKLADYVGSFLRKKETDIVPEPMKYDVMLLYIQLLPADTQYEILKNAPNFTSLITLKKYCHKEAFNHFGDHHAWLSSIWNKVHTVASHGEKTDMIDAYHHNMTMYNVWQKRIGYLSVGIAGLIVFVACIAGIYGFHNMYSWVNVILPIIQRYIHVGLDELRKLHPLIHTAVNISCWPYYNYFKLIVINTILSFTRFNQSIIAKLLTCYSTCIFSIMMLPFRVAKKSAGFIFNTFTWISKRVGQFGFNMINYYYEDALKNSKELFIQEVINY